MKSIKQIITVVVVAFFMLTSFSVKTNTTNEDSLNYELNVNPNTRDDVSKFILTVEVEFGRKSKSCQDFGVCNVSGSTETGIFVASNREGSFVLGMQEKGLAKIQKRFKGNVIVLEEDFVLPIEITKKLKLKEGYTLKTGKYKLKTGKNKNKDSAYYAIF